MTNPANKAPAENPYRPALSSRLGTPFGEVYDVLWEAERRFDLVFRRDGGVPVWVANRVRIYYEVMAQSGLLDRPASASSPSPAQASPPHGNPADLLVSADLLVQTGATGPATENRARPFGCLYTDAMVRHMLEIGSRVLLVHDAPERLRPHPNLHAITIADLRAGSRAVAGASKVAPHVLDPAAETHWATVSAFLHAELGVELMSPTSIPKLVHSYQQQVRWHRAALRRIRPGTAVYMAHYFRAPQIAAARSLRIHAIDYQHGINSRYHMGYGYPGIAPEARAIPDFPDEFWSWGEAWTDPAWFPRAAVRLTDHPALVDNAPDNVPDNDEADWTADWAARPAQTVLLATTWAMRSEMSTAAAALATAYPDWTIRIKPHPREDAATYAALAAAHPGVEVLTPKTDIMQAARGVRYVLGVCSSALFDVLLVGCRIAVLRLPGLEYMEDFVSRYGVPVVEPNGSGFDVAVTAMGTQAIKGPAVFHRMSGVEQILREESLSIPFDAVRAPEPIPAAPQAAGIAGAWMSRRIKRALDTPEGLAALTADRPPDLRARIVALIARRLQIPAYHKALQARLVADGPGGSDLRILAEALKAALLALDRGADPLAFRLLLRRALLEHDHRIVRLRTRLLALVEADNRPKAAVMRAEFHEHHVLAAPTHHETTKSEAAWDTACHRLAAVAPVTARMAGRLRDWAGEAQQVHLDTRIDPTAVATLRGELLGRLRDGAPLSMVRVGDGEVYAFDAPYVPSEVQEADRVLREHIWWGRRMPEATRARLRAGVQAAIGGADLLGPPAPWRLLRDMPRLLPKMRGPIGDWPATARAHRILSEELEALRREGRLDWSVKALIDERCHQDLFAPAALGEFRRIDRPQVLVSPFPVEEVNRAVARFTEGPPFFSDGIRLPPHSKVRTHVPDDTLARAAMPERLDDLLAEVEHQAARGAVFWVAGGVAGKILIDRVRACGAAALDVGAVADYWMGLETRGPLDFRAFTGPLARRAGAQ